MYMKQDWLMRQIEVVSVAISRLVFGKGEVAYDIKEEALQRSTDFLRAQLLVLVGEGQIGRAEDLLFDTLHPEDHDGLLLALDFYRRLNGLTDEALEISGFSREEIMEGLHAAAERFGLYLPGLI